MGTIYLILLDIQGNKLMAFILAGFIALLEKPNLRWFGKNMKGGSPSSNI